LAQSIHYTEEAIANSRLHLVAGLAAIEIAQTVKEFWSAPKSFRNKQGQCHGDCHVIVDWRMLLKENANFLSGKRYSWRDAADISVKWIR